MHIGNQSLWRRAASATSLLPLGLLLLLGRRCPLEAPLGDAASKGCDLLTEGAHGCSIPRLSGCKQAFAHGVVVS